MGTYVGTGGAVTGGAIGTITSHPFFIFTAAGGPKMTVLANGNVGVNETVPSQKFQVTDVTASTSGSALIENNTLGGGAALRANTATTATGAGTRYGTYSTAWYGQGLNYGTYSYLQAGRDLLRLSVVLSQKKHNFADKSAIQKL